MKVVRGGPRRRLDRLARGGDSSGVDHRIGEELGGDRRHLLSFIGRGEQESAPNPDAPDRVDSELLEPGQRGIAGGIVALGAAVNLDPPRVGRG